MKLSIQFNEMDSIEDINESILVELGDQMPNWRALRSNWKKFGYRGEEKRMQDLKGNEDFF